MKKHILLILGLVFTLAINANPIDEISARKAGQQFANANFRLRNNASLELVYTGVSTRGEICYYAYNVDNSGFIIVSADDRFRPIVAYSTEGTFETENMSPEAKFYLDKVIEARTNPNAVVAEDAQQEWQSLYNSGKLISRNNGKDATHLCQTKWNQDSPYNLYAPEANGGPDGRCYAGCVATAMSQVMKYWDYPQQGSGHHSYHCYYGTLSADFGATTYDWEHMPKQIISSTTQQETEAIALLMYHCAVAVNMNFGPDGSGAYSDDVTESIRQYFSYSNQAQLEYRDFYSLSEWQNKLKESFDRNWPVYYSGYSENGGGHAFVCDGYDDNDLFHFNWGWDGSNDGWFVIDEIDYAGWAGAIFNFVPSHVYQNMPKQPENLSVVSHNDTECSATITWNNPTQNIHNNTLQNIDKIVVCRDGQIIYSEENVQPGETMEFTDHYLPTMVEYSVYAISNSAKGLAAKSAKTNLGPTCNWTIEIENSDTQNWGSAYLSVTNSSGIEIAKIQPVSADIQTLEIPLGHVSISWNPGSDMPNEIHFVIKDYIGNTITSFEGNPTELPRGVFFIVNNTCGNDETCNAPINLSVTHSNGDVILNWTDNNNEAISYFIYRDGLLYALSKQNTFIDENAADVFHTYKVTTYCTEGESSPSQECNAYVDSECQIPTGLRYEKINSNKIKLIWDAPEAEGVNGYMVYRRAPGADFKRIKLTSSTNYTDNLSSLACDHYQYAVAAYYSASQCESAFASIQGSPAVNVLDVNKTIIPCELSVTIDGQNARLTWHEAITAESYDIYRNGDLIAQNLTETEFVDSDITSQSNYCYFIIGKTGNVSSSRSNTACIDWTLLTEEESEQSGLHLYPNPATTLLFVKANGMKHISIFNTLGQCVYEKDTEIDCETISISDLPQGHYIIKVAGAEGITIEKFVKL